MNLEAKKSRLEANTAQGLEDFWMGVCMKVMYVWMGTCCLSRLVYICCQELQAGFIVYKICTRER